MIDAELFVTDDSDGPSQLLSGLLTHDLIELMMFADDGPPIGTPTINHPRSGDVTPGWVVVGPLDKNNYGRPVTYANRKTVTRSGIIGNAADVAETDVDSAAYRSLSSSDAVKRRLRDALAGQAAECMHADIYVTNREYLHSISWSLARAVSFLRPEQALPLVSLYLRTQGQFLVWRSSDGAGTYTFNRGLFYWVGTREVLPASWRWFGACVQHDATTPDHALTSLGNSVLKRIQRAIELRDHVHRALNQPQDNDVADDALVAFDSCMVFLMGAMDASARVAHHVLGMQGQLRQAGWQHRPSSAWMTELAGLAPDLAALVAPGSTGRSALTVLSVLRNTVHSAALTPVGILTSVNKREKTLIDFCSDLTPAQITDLLAAIDALGGREAWSVEGFIYGRYLADPGVILERLLPLVLSLLDALMENTPVELLPGVTITPSSRLPPSGPDDTFSQSNRESIRWQLGL